MMSIEHIGNVGSSEYEASYFYYPKIAPSFQFHLNWNKGATALSSFKVTSDTLKR